MRKYTIVVLLLLMISTALFAAGERCKSSKTCAEKTKTTKAVCPVMGTKLNKENAYDSVEYEGKTYYFCCAGCKPEFEKNPTKYIK